MRSEDKSTANGKMNLVKSFFSGGAKGALINLAILLLILVLPYIFTLIFYGACFIGSLIGYNEPIREFLNWLSKQPMFWFIVLTIFQITFGGLLVVCITVSLWFFKFLELQLSNKKRRIEEIEKENQRMKKDCICKICWSNQVGVVFLPCGHLISCVNCSPKLKDCPFCRQFIKGKIKTFS